MSWRDRADDQRSTLPHLERAITLVAQLPSATLRARTLAACSDCAPSPLKQRITREAVESLEQGPVGLRRWSTIREAIERLWPPAGDPMVVASADEFLGEVEDSETRALLLSLLAEDDMRRWDQLLTEVEAITDPRTRADLLVKLPQWPQHEWGLMADDLAKRILQLLEGIDPDSATRALQFRVLPPPLDWPSGWSRSARLGWSHRALPPRFAEQAIAVALTATDPALATAGTLEISGEHEPEVRHRQRRNDLLTANSRLSDAIDRVTSLCVMLESDWDLESRGPVSDVVLDSISTLPDEDARVEMLRTYAYAGVGGATHGHSTALAIAEGVAAPHLKARALAALAFPVHSDVKSATLRSAMAIEDPEARATAVFAFGGHHPPEGLTLAMWRTELMRLALDVRDSVARVRFLCDLGGDYEPGSHPPGAPTLEEILQQAVYSWRSVDDPYRRARGSNLLLALLDGFESHHPEFEPLSAKAWTATEDIPPARRTAARMRLVQHLHGALRSRAAEMLVRELLDEPHEASLPDNLARTFGPWMQMPSDSEVHA